MAEGGLPPKDYPGRSLGYGRFYPPNFEVRESLDDYMDAQPLDFSTKRRKSSESENDDTERYSTIERRVNNLDISGRYSLADSSASPQLSRDVEDPFRRSPMSLVIPSEPCNSSLSSPHLAEPSPPVSLSSSLTTSTLARLHSSPLLLSTLQSALNRSNMSEQGRSYITPRNSPPPSEYSSPAVHSTDLDHMPEERVFQAGGLGGLRGASGAGTSGLGAGGLGAGSLGIGGGLRVSGLGRRGSSSSGNPYEDPSHSFDSLGAYASLSHNLATDNITLLGTAYSTIAAMSSAVASAQSEVVMTEESNASYLKFRDEMLKQVQAAKYRRAPHRSTSSEENSEDKSDENKDSTVLGDITEEPEETSADVSNNEIPNDDSENAENNQNGAQEDTSGGARRKSRANNDVVKDEAYWERRRKNNEAAKRSRDARRAKEDEIAIRAAYLEQENIKLKVELSSLKAETSKLRYLFYS